MLALSSHSIPAQTFEGINFGGSSVGECASRVEDKMMLRERTLQLLELLTVSEHRSIALVTHKGYLCEVRRVTLCCAFARVCEQPSRVVCVIS